MKEKSLLNELIKQIMDSISNNDVSKQEILRFLLNKSEDNFYSKNEYSVNNCIYGNTIPDFRFNFEDYTWTIDALESYLKHQYSSQKNKPTVDHYKLEKALHQLFNKIFPDKDDTEMSVNDIIYHILCFHCFCTYNYSVQFNTPKPPKIRNYVSFKSKETEFKNALSKHRLIYVTGQAGSGKTCLVNHILNNSCYKDIGIAILKPGDTLCKLEKLLINSDIFPEDIMRGSLDAIKENLIKKDSFSILVIDIPVFTEEDLLFLKEFTNRLQLKIIIISRHITDSGNLGPVINMDDPPIDFLKALFNQYYGDNFFTDDEFILFENNIDKNILLTTLIAKSLGELNKANEDNKTGKSAKGNKTIINAHNLLLSNDWLGMLKYLPSVRNMTIEKQSFNSIYKILAYILDPYPEDIINLMVKISIWTHCEIPVRILRSKFDDCDLSTAFAYGFIHYTDDNKQFVKMYKILTAAIWLNIFEKPDMYIQNTIYPFENSIVNDTFQRSEIKYIYNIIFNMVYRLHFLVTFKNKITTDHEARPDETDILIWNTFLIDVIRFLKLYGDFETAYHLYNTLFVQTNTRGIEHQSNDIKSKALRFLLFPMQITNTLVQHAPNKFKSEITCLTNYFKQVQQGFSPDVPYKFSEYEQVFYRILDKEITYQRYTLLNMLITASYAYFLDKLNDSQKSACKKQSFNSESREPLSLIIEVYEKLMDYMSPSDFYYNYYQMNYHQIKSLYYNNPTDRKSAQDIFQIICIYPQKVTIYLPSIIQNQNYEILFFSFYFYRCYNAETINAHLEPIIIWQQRIEQESSKFILPLKIMELYYLNKVLYKTIIYSSSEKEFHINVKQICEEIVDHLETQVYCNISDYQKLISDLKNLISEYSKDI